MKRRAARERYHAAPTRQNRRALAKARRHAARVLAHRVAARHALHAARAHYATCVVESGTTHLDVDVDVTPTPTTPPVAEPGVSVSNPRVYQYYGDFPAADVKWSNIPLGAYQLFFRYDGVAQYLRPINFVDVIPSADQMPPPPATGPAPLYWQNDVNYEHLFLGQRCAVTTAQDISIELWTGMEGTSPAGDKIVSSTTVANPCNAPKVTVTNPRIEWYGSNFAVGDVTWSHIPLGQYQYVARADTGELLRQLSVTFVDVAPPPPTWDPQDPMPPTTPNYWQNDVTYTGFTFGGGCDETPGQSATLQLLDTAGVAVAATTVDNPCR